VLVRKAERIAKLQKLERSKEREEESSKKEFDS
jgi:hypothetical protein